MADLFPLGEEGYDVDQFLDGHSRHQTVGHQGGLTRMSLNELGLRDGCDLPTRIDQLDLCIGLLANEADQITLIHRA